jgi:alpha-beta hydrolase superfamily lysophospholipase
MQQHAPCRRARGLPLSLAGLDAQMKRRSIAVAIVGLSVLALAGLYGIGWQLSRPVPALIGPAPEELHAEPVTFQSESGSTIHGWLSRGPSHAGAILLLPGVRANRLSMVSRAEFLRAAGYSTLMIDFQATGESPGAAITFGWLERLDVIAAVQELKRTFPGEPIGIIGMSLGGAATALASSSLDVQAVILEAVYPSLDVAVENRLRMRLGPFGAALAPLLLLQLRPRLGVWPSDLRPVDRIALLRCPILVIAGVADQHTTATDTQRLYTAARQPKELWLIPNARHVDYLRAVGEEYKQRVLAFFKAALTTRQPANNNQTVGGDLPSIK